MLLLESTSEQFRFVSERSPTSKNAEAEGEWAEEREGRRRWESVSNLTEVPNPRATITPESSPSKSKLMSKPSTATWWDLSGQALPRGGTWVGEHCHVVGAGCASTASWWELGGRGGVPRKRTLLQEKAVWLGTAMAGRKAGGGAQGRGQTGCDGSQLDLRSRQPRVLCAPSACESCRIAGKGGAADARWTAVRCGWDLASGTPDHLPPLVLLPVEKRKTSWRMGGYFLDHTFKCSAARCIFLQPVSGTGCDGGHCAGSHSAGHGRCVCTVTSPTRLTSSMPGGKLGMA